ncbi:MAG: hypothetical protein Q7U35_05825 [Methanobacteriaceae archaeon]|nr:hypothetical protein [Methanobacteriaceae archaeon]MDP2836278.1 hypothetical protein [Methanobacteriaceae archaeon]MDP3034761.1 hypothetical protein [Methanobacteriaceae archaeon]MDP3484955.1 hypothetical protein [Methanobacteriaceae archaeon]MDP3624525.1 hypothetical protein [Methanobacteriaceae archaeon]
MKKYLMGFLVLIFLLLGPCSASSPQEVSDAIVTPDSQQYITEVLFFILVKYFSAKSIF